MKQRETLRPKRLRHWLEIEMGDSTKQIERKR